MAIIPTPLGSGAGDTYDDNQIAVILDQVVQIILSNSATGPAGPAGPTGPVAAGTGTTGPTGPLARVVRAHAECSPCLLRECPIDHRCMTGVTAEQAAAAALQLWEESAPAWTHETKS